MASPGLVPSGAVKGKVTSRSSNKKTIGRRTQNNYGFKLKFLKACAFCRKRKLKCTVLSNEQSCENCLARGMACVFDYKVVDGDNVGSIISLSESKINLKSDGDPFIQFVDTPLRKMRDSNVEVEKNEPVNKRLLPNLSPGDDVSNSSKSSEIPRLSSTAEALQIYVNEIEIYTPFIDNRVFASCSQIGEFESLCIRASRSVGNGQSDSKNEILEKLKFYVDNSDADYWDMNALSFFFLLPLRINISRENIVEKLNLFNSLQRKSTQALSINLVLGAFITDTFNALINEDHELITNVQVFALVSDHIRNLDKSSFAYHFLGIHVLLYRLRSLASDNSKSYNCKRLEMVQFEYDLLLWPVELPKELIVVEDELQATSEAFFLHVMHNTLMLEFYTLALENRNVYGEMNSIFAVPGLYQFLAGMVKSNFVVKAGFFNSWSLLDDCGLHTAKLCLRLLKIMEFDSLVSALKFYHRSWNVRNFYQQEGVINEIQRIVKNSKYYDTKDNCTDGAKVFWVFRDVRSMSLVSYMNEIKRNLE